MNITQQKFCHPILRLCIFVGILILSKRLGSHKYKHSKRPPTFVGGLSILVEMTGIEPVSEKRSTLVSPGAVHLQDSPIGRPVNGPPLR